MGECLSADLTNLFTAASAIPAYGRFRAFISARARARADSLSRDEQRSTLPLDNYILSKDLKQIYCLLLLSLRKCALRL